MPSRALPFAVITAALTAIAVTALPWFNLRKLGMDASWNGLGMGTVSRQDLGLAPNARGWLIVAAAVFAVLAGLVALMPSATARPLGRIMAAVAAVGATAAAFVPIAIWIRPSWYFGDFLSGLGFYADAEVDISVSKVILTALIVILLLLAGLCAALFVERSQTAPVGDRHS
ncbi:MAG: hypothetical protein WBA05_00295 [Gordonia sp. (in: high G+C Gram-positive bacteria)]|uniref:hypothetical protein n=1 Tax=Gordonia TaxID=2053 RepID=UPI003266298C